MEFTRPLFVVAASVVASCALAGGAWAAVHADGTEPAAPAPVAAVEDGTQPGVEGTGAWIDEHETVPFVQDGTQPGVEGTGAWIDVHPG